MISNEYIMITSHVGTRIPRYLKFCLQQISHFTWLQTMTRIEPKDPSKVYDINLDKRL